MQFLNVKTNALRRQKNNEYKLTCKSNLNALCEACLQYDNCKRRKLEQVKTCSDFTPILVFIDGHNLDTPKVNTLRIGQAWYKRLHVGQMVGVFCRNDQSMSTATISELYWSDDKPLMIATHGNFNHLGINYLNQYSKIERIIQSNYGRNFYLNAKGMTAIYLENFKPLK